MRKLLILCPTRREHRDLPELAKELNCELFFDAFGDDYFDRFLAKDYRQGDNDEYLDIIALIKEVVGKYRAEGLSGVTSGVGYPGMSGVSIVAQELALPGPSPKAIMLCEHKYFARLAEEKLVPAATPAFQLVDPKLSGAGEQIKDFPVFLKPVKSCMSMNAFRISNSDELKKAIESALLPEGFIKPFNDMTREYTDLPDHASYLLVEGLLEGNQVSLEGYVSAGKVHIMGILDSIMFPGTISFRRFQYPSGLPEQVQRQMHQIAQTLMTGIGYNNAPFNIELIHNPKTGQVHIIEVNPKIASQFPDLFKKVDGTSSYSVIMQLALGEEPTFKRGQGQFKIAASCVLRTFEDQHVLAVPSPEQIARVKEEFPDALIEIYAPVGKNLSDQMQDAQSFRYGLVNIGADSEEELEAKFETIKRMLEFKFARV